MAEGFESVEQLTEESVDIMASVKIGAEEFSIVKVPSSKTTAVAEQRELLLESFELNVLVEELGRVGNFVRIAYNGVAGYTELQIQIREIGYDVTRLCDKSAIVVSQFKQASGGILDDLQGTYQFLLDGMENIALLTLAAVSDVAKGIAPAVAELQREFEAESHKVEEALKIAMMGKKKEMARKKEIAENNVKYEEKKRRSEKRRRSSELRYIKSEQWYKEAEREEITRTSIKNPLKAIVYAFVAPEGYVRFNEESDEGLAKKYREEKLKHLDEMKKQRNLQQKAIRDISECIKKMKDCSDSPELATVAIDALHQAMGGLQKLSLVMLNIEAFWKQIQVHCEALTKDKMQDVVTKAMEMPKRERLRKWTATGFKREAIAYYAQWVALDDVCAECLANIMETKKALHGYLTENPTVEEARANVHRLAAMFSEELKRAHDKIGQKNADAERERSRILSARGSAV